jgi:predicted phosphodiesterase
MKIYILSDLHYDHPDCKTQKITKIISKAILDKAKIIIDGDWLDGYLRDISDVEKKSQSRNRFN